MDKASSLSEIIIDQHGYLEDTHSNIITFILNGKTNYNVLLLIDGYDEYKPGTNKDIDKVIEQGIGNCTVVLTSRPGFLGKQIKDKFDDEIILGGFNEKNIKLCTSKYLQSEEKSLKLLREAKNAGIDDLLRVPIILLLTCVVYDERQMLPNRKTELVRIIFEMLINRTTHKSSERKSQEMKNIEMLLLGKYSWQSLQNNVNQLLLNKVNYQEENIALIWK